MAKKRKQDGGESLLPGTLEIKLGACLTSPTKRFYADLDRIAYGYRQCFNAALQAWLVWRFTHPEWSPPLRPDGKGPQNLPMPQKLGKPKDPDKEVGWSTWLYDMARLACPEIASNVANEASRAVAAKLQANTPYNHAGNALFHSEAIMLHEANPSFLREDVMGLPAANFQIGYLGHAACKTKTGEPSEGLAEIAKDNAVLQVTLFSKESGRAVLAPRCRLRVGALGDKRRDILRRIVTGQLEYTGSKLVKKDGQWFLHLGYKHEGQNLKLDKSRQADLSPNDDKANFPFRFRAPGGEMWDLPFEVATLIKAFRRIEDKRRFLKKSYGFRGQGVRGHGRRRVYQNLRPSTRLADNLAGDFYRLLIHKIVRFCESTNCGTLVYHEPSLQRREHSWFKQHGIPFAWQTFESKLKHQCRKYGIELVVTRKQAA